MDSFTKHILENGTRVLVDADSRFESVAVGVCLLGGLRSESLEEVGITHLLEHMLFKRTERMNTREIAERIDSLGGDINAFTDADSLCLHGVVRKQDAYALLDFFSELLLEVAFTEEDFQLEREVVRQEILESDDDPHEVVYRTFSRNFWPQHSLGMPTFGTIETLDSFSYAQTRARLGDLLQGTRLIVSLAGDVDALRVQDAVTSKFGALPKGAGDELSTPKSGFGSTTVEHACGQVYLSLGKPWPGVKDPMFVDGIILSSVLGEGMSSRLFQLLREEQALTYDVSSDIEAYPDTSAFCISGAFEGKNTARALELILGEIEKVCDNQIRSEEIERAVRSHIAQLAMERDSMSSCLWRAIETEMVFGEYRSAAQVIERYKKVTPDSIAQAVTHCFSKEPYLLVLGGELAEVEIPSQVRELCGNHQL